MDFKLLYRAAQLANQAYDGKSDILGAYPGDAAWVSAPGKYDVQYVLLRNDLKKIQAIAVRGTVNDVNWDLDMDTRGAKDQKAGILLHRGFRVAAETIYRDVRPRLKANYLTYLTGHSLGGAVALILGMYLDDDEFRIGGIFTFGQPKVTNIAGATVYSNLPVLRVIYQNDVVALYPNELQQGSDQFAHVGAVVNLLSGPHYVYATKEQALGFSPGSLQRHFAQISVPDHKMKFYLESLRAKLDKSVEVSFADRNKYIFRHRGHRVPGQGGNYSFGPGKGKNFKARFD